MMTLNDLFGGIVSVGSSVSPSVRQGASDRLTGMQIGVGEHQLKMWTARDMLPDAHIAAMLPALIAQVIDVPISKITPMARYERVMVARVIPAQTIDPVLPFVIGPRTMRYRECYRRYWQALMRYLSWTTWPGARRRMNSAARRLVLQLNREGLTPAEQAFFRVWLEHGPLGEYVLGS